MFLIDISNTLIQVSDFHLDGHNELSSGNSNQYAFPKEHFVSQKAISLPSSPHEYRSQALGRSGADDDMISTWNKILESPMFQNKPLLPFHEWNIDFSEITVGTRVGIGERSSSISPSFVVHIILLIYLYNLPFLHCFSLLKFDANCMCVALQPYEREMSKIRYCTAILM